MKQTNTRRFIFALLVTASFVSFIFLNTVNVPQTDAVKEYTEEVEEEEKREVGLPDVEVVKMIIQKSKRFLPVS